MSMALFWSDSLASKWSTILKVGDQNVSYKQLPMESMRYFKFFRMLALATRYWLYNDYVTLITRPIHRKSVKADIPNKCSTLATFKTHEMALLSKIFNVGYGV
jgi:hypothetical protein